MFDVTLHQLRVFREVVTRGTMAAAAESLGYTPSAISQAMNALERAVGRAVFERVGRSVQPTDLGRNLLVHANDLLAGVERAQAELERSATEVRGTFTIGVFESMALTALVPLLSTLSDRHPALQVQTDELMPQSVAEEVLSGALDMAFVIDYPHAPHALPDGVTSQLMLTERFWLVTPRGHRLAPGPVPLAALADESLIAPPISVSCGRCVVLACRAAGFEPKVHHRIDDYTTTLRMVEAGLSSALIPDLGLTDLSRDVEVIELTDRVDRQILAIHRKSSAGRPALNAVLQASRDVFTALAVLSPDRASAEPAL